MIRPKNQITIISIFLYLVAIYVSGAVRDSQDAPAMPRSSFEQQLVARQLGFDFNCGLNLNVFGRVSPLMASGQANLCLQCRFNALGIVSVDFSFFNSLVSTINSHGVSARDASVIQNFIQMDLNNKARQQTSSQQCQAAFVNDKRCASSRYLNGQCTATSIDCVKNNRNGLVLAQAFQSIFRHGGVPFCSICSGDKSCTNPSARAVRRSPPPTNPDHPRCPNGQTACPISHVISFTPSTPYECLDIHQEISSCGGCVTLGEGTDCSGLRGARSSGCSGGKCTIFSCARGFQLSQQNQTCTRSQRHPPMAPQRTGDWQIKGR